jgi:hypothetical protein
MTLSFKAPSRRSQRGRRNDPQRNPFLTITKEGLVEVSDYRVKEIEGYARHDDALYALVADPDGGCRKLLSISLHNFDLSPLYSKLKISEPEFANCESSQGEPVLPFVRQKIASTLISLFNKQFEDKYITAGQSTAAERRSICPASKGTVTNAIPSRYPESILLDGRGSNSAASILKLEKQAYRGSAEELAKASILSPFCGFVAAGIHRGREMEIMAK